MAISLKHHFPKNFEILFEKNFGPKSHQFPLSFQNKLRKCDVGNTIVTNDNLRKILFLNNSKSRSSGPGDWQTYQYNGSTSVVKTMQVYNKHLA